MKRKVIGVMLVTSMLCASLFSGCGNQQSVNGSEVAPTKVSEETSKTTETKQEESSEPKELNILAGTNAYVENIETNKFTVWYEEYSGVHVNWEISEDPAQAFSLKVVGEDLPDIYYGQGVNRAMRDLYGADGVLIDLTELIEEHAPNIKKMFDENPTWKSACTSSDGAIYGVPYLNYSNLNEYQQIIWVYEPWLEALNVTPESIKTTDDLYELFKLVAETDLNGNGKKDEIPFASRGMKNSYGLLGLMNNFIDKGYNWMNLKNDEAIFVPVTEEWREGLRWIHKLYEEGLILADSISLDRTTITSLGESETPVLFASIGLWAPYFTTNGSDRSTEFVAIPPVMSPSGHLAAQKNGSVSGSTVMHITSACEDPVTAIKWLDGLWDEEPASKASIGSLVPAQDGQVAINGEKALYMSPLSATEAEPNSNWGTFYMGIKDPEQDLYTYYESPNAHAVAVNRWDALELYQPYGVDLSEVSMNMIILDDAESAEYSDILAAINTYMQSSAASFITGEMSLDTDWDGYVKTIEDYGLARLLELAEKGAVIFD